MTPEQLQELMDLNPEGIPIQYDVIADKHGEIKERHVSVVANVRNAAGLKNGLFDYCDRYVRGEEV